MKSERNSLLNMLNQNVNRDPAIPIDFVNYKSPFAGSVNPGSAFVPLISYPKTCHSLNEKEYRAQKRHLTPSVKGSGELAEIVKRYSDR